MATMALEDAGPARRGGILRALVILLLALASVLFLGWEGRFVVAREGLLPNLDFAEGGKAWRIGGPGVRLPARAGEPLVIEGGDLSLVSQYLRQPDRFEHVRVAVTLAARALVPGPEAWQRGGVLLRAFGDDGRLLWYWPYEVVLVAGEREWRRYQRVFPVGEAAAMRLFVYNAGRAGRLLVRDIALDAVVEPAWARAARLALLAGWGLALLWLAPALVRAAGRRWLGWATLAVGAGIALGVLTPQPLLSDTLEGLEARFEAVSASEPPAAATAGAESPAKGAQGRAPGAPAKAPVAGAAAPEESAAEARPIEESAPLLGAEERAHLLAFALLGALALAAFPGAGRVVLYLVVAALALEAVQAFSITRTASFTDAGLNLAGVLAGALLVASARRALARRPAA